MFANCTALTKIDLSAWEKPEKTIYMQSTFSGCTNLTEIDFGSNFSKAEVAIFKETFSGCEKLSALDVSGFDTSNVTDMSYMFKNCKALTSLDVSNFDTSKVTTMEGMFGRCYAFVTLDLRSFTNENLTNVGNMFFDCTNLTTIYAKAGADWTTNLTAAEGGSGVFNECSNLVGGSGSSFATLGYWGMYAKIDGGTSSPGYFTPVTYIGTKVPTEAKAVGDIVFSDGSATPYTSNLTLTDTQKSAAVAVIFYVGTVCNNDTDTVSRTLGVGLAHSTKLPTSGLEWCTASASAYNTNITYVQCNSSGSAGNYTFLPRTTKMFREAM